MKTVDVWRASLDMPASEVARLGNLLSEEERNRASLFKKEIDRARYIAGRTTLRILIGEYTSIPPGLIRLHDLPGGKPALEAAHDFPQIHFNASHSGGIALFAFSDQEVGIDVELVASNGDMSRIAANFFSHSESAACAQLEGPAREHFFFRTWVRKEAYLKATGNGLSFDPSHLCIGDSEGSEATLTRANGRPQIDHAFQVFDIAGMGDYVAAIAVAASICTPTIQVREFTPAGRHLPGSRIPRELEFQND